MFARTPLTLALAIVALSVLVTPATRDLFVGDETKYGQVVRETRATGAFFLPTLGGTPFTHKPPLHFWMIDLLTYPLGTRSTWAFVLPSIAAFLALLWLMHRRGGALAAFVCGTALMVWASAQTARMDVGFTLFIALGLLFMERGKLIASGAALGVATLIKGPMAIVIGVVTWAIERVRRHDPATPQPSNPVTALIVSLAIPAAWFLPAMRLGGAAYTRDVVMKQTVGRAVSSWVHSAPPWFYLLHLPATMFPWFFLGLVAVIAKRREWTFVFSWMLAVIVPYSLLSSKLDVYMMAMIPALALVIADFLRDADATWLRRAAIANRVTLGLLFLALLLALNMAPRELKPALFASGLVGFLAFLLGGGSAIVTGLAPIAALLAFFIPMHRFVNDYASTRPLIAAIERQHVAPEEVALFSCPYLWSRDLPPELERVRCVAPEDLRTTRPAVIATSRAHAKEIAYALDGYRVGDTGEMIGKKFDVYRR